MMKKALKWFLLTAAVVMIIASLMGATCTINPGPGPTQYAVQIHNNYGNTIHVYLNGVYLTHVITGMSLSNFTNVYFSIGNYLSVYIPSTLQWVSFPVGLWGTGGPSNTQYTVNSVDGSVTFTLNGGGGWTVSER